MKTYKSALGKWFIVDSFASDLAEEIINSHKQNMEKELGILKKDHKRQLSRVIIKGKSYVVKEFIKPGPWWIFRPDARSWKNSHILRSLNIPVAKTFAWLKSKDRKGFIIMEDLGDQVLGKMLKTLSPNSSERMFFIKQIAQLAGFIHSKNVLYGDLKLTNVIIKDKNLFLPDMDKIKIKKRLKIKDRIYNLEQMINSFPEDIMEEEIELFFKEYFYIMGSDLLKNKLKLDIISNKTKISYI